ncbi:MAG: type II secretion system F family protein [Planctomycetia bacterium]|nr:type II secretion system F family protein [Planctomycetia bacterium]
MARTRALKQPAVAAAPNVAPAYAAILRSDELFGTGQGKGLEDRLNSAFDMLLIRSGLGVAPSLFLMLSAFTALTLGGILFVAQENVLTTTLGIIIGGAAPVIWAVLAQSRRVQKMLQQLPDMVDELARAARTGRSVEQCFMLVAHDTPAPLGDELKRCAGRLDLGIGMHGALTELPVRTGIVSMKILVMALSVHAQSGGDLIGVLERLSRTIRGRISYLARLRASTAASRATTILMLVIPPLVLGFFVLRDPTYFTRLMAVKWGRIMTMIAAVLDMIGVVWVLRILKSNQQS